MKIITLISLLLFSNAFAQEAPVQQLSCKELVVISYKMMGVEKDPATFSVYSPSEMQLSTEELNQMDIEKLEEVYALYMPISTVANKVYDELVDFVSWALENPAMEETITKALPFIAKHLENLAQCK